MHRLGNLDNLILEQATGVGVGQHDRGYIWRQFFLQRRHIYPATVIGGDLFDAIAADGRSGGIGPMRRCGHQHHLARVALSLQRGPNGHQTAEFTMGAGGRRHGNRRHAGQFYQPFRQGIDQFQGALHGFHRLQRMQVGETRQPRHFLVQARIVLHGAGAQGVEPRINGKIIARQTYKVAHDLRFRKAGQTDGRAAFQTAQAVWRIGRLGQINAATAGAIKFEDQRFGKVQAAMAAVGRNCLRASHYSTSRKALTRAAASSSVLVSVVATNNKSAIAGLLG